MIEEEVRKMKIGVAGNGGIVKQALAALAEEKIPVMSLWCRSEERGRPVAEAFNIQDVKTDYDAFLAEDTFDTVYIGLVNSAHYEYAKRALEAGKNVIVEKPFTSTYAEAAELADLAEEKNLFLFEAIMLRYSRNYEAIMKNLEKVGELSLVRSNYSQYSSRYDAYLEGKVLPAFDPEFSGGALYDINVYNVHFVTGLFGSPKYTLYMANKGYNGIDTSGILLMDYGLFKAVCTGAKDSASASGTVLQGSLGTISIDERPGYVRNVKFHDRVSGKDEILDVESGDAPMRTEFARMQEVMEKKDYRQARIWMNHSLQVMAVLDQSRTDAGIDFAADHTEEEAKPASMMDDMFRELFEKKK